MDRDVWAIIMSAIRAAAREVKAPWRREPDFPDWLIVAMDVWRTAHNQTLSWACDRAHYGPAFRPRKRTKDGRCLPSVSQFSRRVKADAVQAILQRVDDRLSGRGARPTRLRFVDGKPLTVSPVSKDPDARRGHVYGGFARGYKLHAFVDDRRRIQVWSVAPLNVAEQSVAMAMLPSLPPAPGGLEVGDGNYDSAPLYKRVPASTGAMLLTPLKGQKRVKGGKHHPVTLRQMGPERRAAVEAWDKHPALARYVTRQRNTIEGVFSVLVTACGLALPACVRRLDRVRRWAGMKIIVYHARLLAQERAAAAPAA